MNTEKKRLTKISFPFSLYLKQLFAADTYVRFINPFNFWQRYRINHLERCRELDIVQYFESCRKLSFQGVKYTEIGLNRDCTDTSANSSSKQTELNTIYIRQPLIELKYRGVSYYIKDTLNTNINAVKIDPSAVKSNSLRSTDNSNNANTPDFFSSNQ